MTSYYKKLCENLIVGITGGIIAGLIILSGIKFFGDCFPLVMLFVIPFTILSLVVVILIFNKCEELEIKKKKQEVDKIKSEKKKINYPSEILAMLLLFFVASIISKSIELRDGITTGWWIIFGFCSLFILYHFTRKKEEDEDRLINRIKEEIFKPKKKA